MTNRPTSIADWRSGEQHEWAGYPPSDTAAVDTFRGPS
jgi:hypothetical protein